MGQLGCACDSVPAPTDGGYATRLSYGCSPAGAARRTSRSRVNLSILPCLLSETRARVAPSTLVADGAVSSGIFGRDVRNFG